MDITAALTTGVSSHVIGKTFQENSTYLINSNFNSTLAEILRNTKDTSCDALQAVKLDPAVLEAQVTVDTKIKPSSSDRSDDNQASSEKNTRSRNGSFKDLVSAQEAALLSLTTEQYDFLLKYADNLRDQRHSIQKSNGCAFCKNNGEALSWYSSHLLKDGRGKVRCPVLRGLHCPRCGATGDIAHTIKYCPGHSNCGNSSHSSSI